MRKKSMSKFEKWQEDHAWHLITGAWAIVVLGVAIMAWVTR